MQREPARNPLYGVGQHWRDRNHVELAQNLVLWHWHGVCEDEPFHLVLYLPEPLGCGVGEQWVCARYPHLLRLVVLHCFYCFHHAASSVYEVIHDYGGHPLDFSYDVHGVCLSP